MKTFVAALVVLAAISVSQAGLDRKQAIEILEKCKKETNAKESVAETYDKEKIPETREGKCMMACVLREQGLMKDGKVSGAAVSEFVEKHYGDDPEQVAKFAEGIGHCSVKVDAKGKDQCELAYSYMKCGQEKGIKLT